MIAAIGIGILGFLLGIIGTVVVLVPMTERMADRARKLDNMERRGEVVVRRYGGWLWGRVKVSHRTASVLRRVA